MDGDHRKTNEKCAAHDKARDCWSVVLVNRKSGLSDLKTLFLG